MRMTNERNWDPDIVEVLKTVVTHGPVQDRVWMSHLASPPRLRQLQIRHFSDPDYVIDASHVYRRFLGVAIHAAIEDRSPSDDSKNEEKLIIPMRGVKVVGRSDKWRNGTVKDWKTTHPFSFVRSPEGKPEYWVALEAYGYGFRVIQNLTVEHLALTALLLGFDRHRAAREPDYPQSEVVGPIVKPAMPTEVAEAMIHNLLDAHLACADLSDEQLPECGLEDRWANPESWAVFKMGKDGWQKRASRVLWGSEDEALDWMEEANRKAKKPATMEVRYRPGESVRCQPLWCDAFQVCPKGQAHRAATERSREDG